jgi:hypothetical protein
MSLLSILLALAATEPAPSMAADAPATCPATPVALPTELASWPSPKPLAAAANAQGLEAATLTPGEAVDLSLRPTPDVTYALRPERPGGSVSHGGMAQVRIEKAGVYRVAISTAAWLDVLRDGKGLTSVAHGHGPDCSGIRKMVDFRLEPGSYVLQIVGNGAPTVRVLVASVPAA